MHLILISIIALNLNTFCFYNYLLAITPKMFSNLGPLLECKILSNTANLNLLLAGLRVCMCMCVRACVCTCVCMCMSVRVHVCSCVCVQSQAVSNSCDPWTLCVSIKQIKVHPAKKDHQTDQPCHNAMNIPKQNCVLQSAACYQAFELGHAPPLVKLSPTYSTVNYEPLIKSCGRALVY